jgi:hypothetical protein
MKSFAILAVVVMVMAGLCGCAHSEIRGIGNIVSTQQKQSAEVADLKKVCLDQAKWEEGRLDQHGKVLGQHGAELNRLDGEQKKLDIEVKQTEQAAIQRKDVDLRKQAELQHQLEVAEAEKSATPAGQATAMFRVIGETGSRYHANDANRDQFKDIQTKLDEMRKQLENNAQTKKVIIVQ